MISGNHALPDAKALRRDIDIVPWQPDGYLELDRQRWKLGPADD